MKVSPLKNRDLRRNWKIGQTQYRKSLTLGICGKIGRMHAIKSAAEKTIKQNDVM